MVGMWVDIRSRPGYVPAMTDRTEGQRIYAIGDIHGRLDLLNEMLARIRGDLVARPHPRPLVIFLGDYMDRGPESRGVLEALIGLKAQELPARFLLGNHDSYIREYLHDPDWYDRTYHWLHDNMGGNRTLESYGVPDATWESPKATHDAFAAVFPDAHMDFVDACELKIQIGGYVFVHAGIRPGVPLEKQDRDDLIWIREPFLSSTADFGFKVVHGHTIVPRVEHRANRIAVDTGAVRTGVLSCLMLEGEETALLTEAGPEPLPLGAGIEGRGLWKSLWMRR
jgi:serine/threonine protein phosphatase 1